MASDPNAPISVEQMAQSFEEDVGEVDLSHYAVEDWVTLAAFWGMALCVFLQFFTRYVLNNSFAWTEEIAANCLVVVVFLGSVMCVRLGRHIAVDLLYHFLPRAVGAPLRVVVDVIGIAFYGYMAWLMWRYVGIVGEERMVTVNLPRGPVFYTVLLAFALMCLRSVQVFVRDLRNPSLAASEDHDAHSTGI